MKAPAFAHVSTTKISNTPEVLAAHEIKLLLSGGRAA
jgi:hypothetical protein